MSMKMMNAAYLVDNVALLSLQEKQDGVESVSYTHLQHQWRIPCGHLCRQRDDDPLWLTNFLCFH